MKPPSVSNSMNQSPLRYGLFLIPILLACFVLSPKARAVLPAPDGGYPGGNTAEGHDALFSLTSGAYNTAVGFFSLRSDITGSFNTAIGAGSLLANTADENTATGAGALLSNTSGTGNTANGAFALFSNTSGVGNTATGDRALFSNVTTGTGDGNLQPASFNSAFGSLALQSNTNGSLNSAFGWNALAHNTSGYSNTANGAQALENNTLGLDNTATGFGALNANTVGGGNTADGAHALFSNTTGGNNTAIGFGALANNSTGTLNTAMGNAALLHNTTGNSNTALGLSAGDNVTTASNVICIGHPGSDISNSCFIGNIRGVTTASGNTLPVLIDAFGQLGTASSSRRFKKEIKPMESASESILSLKPVTFHYKSDQTNTPQFGLIAEEVAEVNPDLVVRDENDEIYTVRYDAVNAMLLNEFLKEHRTVQEQKATITQLKQDFTKQQKQIEVLTAGLQKVSAQIEVTKSAPQTAQNTD